MAGAASIGGWRRGELEGLGNGDLEREGEGIWIWAFCEGARGSNLEFRFGRVAPANDSRCPNSRYGLHIATGDMGLTQLMSDK